MKYAILIIFILVSFIFIFRSAYQIGYTDMYVEHIEERIETETAINLLFKALTEYEKGQ